MNESALSTSTWLVAAHRLSTGPSPEIEAVLGGGSRRRHAQHDSLVQRWPTVDAAEQAPAARRVQPRAVVERHAAATTRRA